MPIPDYQSLMLPILKFMGDEKEHTLSEIIECLYKTSNVSEEEKRQLLPSGQEPVLRNRIRWARMYLERAGLIESPRRASSRITKRGLEVLQQKPAEINVKYLTKFPEFVQFRSAKKEEDKEQRKISEMLDPNELLENAYQRIKNELAEELLKEVKKASPKFFEYVVVELLTRMGYGGSKRDAWRSYRSGWR